MVKNPSKTPVVPAEGETISLKDGQLIVPDYPVVPFIEGDGIGPDIWRATRMVVDAAVERSYDTDRKVCWTQIYAGERSQELFGEWIPQETFAAIRRFRVAIKGPLTTPVGGGMRSANVALRQELDLYACVRPVFWIPGVPCPVKEPQKLDVVVFRENTEDVYAGIEFQAGSDEARKLAKYLARTLKAKVREGSAIGIKPISRECTRRLMRMAIQRAQQERRHSITIVHKGNIMKYTEGAFRDWAYELAADEFPALTVTEKRLYAEHNGVAPAGRLVIKDRIADAMFQQVLLRPAEYRRAGLPEPERGLHQRRPGRAGGRAGHGRGREHRRRHRPVRGYARHRAEVRGPGQGKPRQPDPERPHDARIHGLEGGRRPDPEGPQRRRRRKDRHLRPGAPDGGRQAAEVQRVRAGDH